MTNIKGNIFGGVTAAVVALPLALAFGVSSGAGAAAGLYGAIFVGFFAALFGGTNTQISGPTGPMTVVMAGVLTHFIGQSPEHGIALAFMAVILAGFFQIMFGVLRIGKYIILVPYPVISGFMSGIGVIIIILQIPALLGQKGGADVLSVFLSIPEIIRATDFTAFGLGALTLAIIFLWPAKLKRMMPSPLAALIIGTLVFLFVFSGTDLRTIGEIELGLPSFTLPYFEAQHIKDLITYGLLLAGLGAVDSLLTSLVADNMTGTKHKSDRELIGQGIGNMVAGLFGGLPGAGATMRTAINIHAGGTTKISGIIHSVVLAVIVLGAGGLVENIPHAVLAGILIKVGLDIIDWQFLKRINKLPIFSLALMAGVLLITVFYDLMLAVGLGVFITNLVTIDRLTKIQLDSLFLTDGFLNDENISEEERSILRKAEGKALLFNIEGPMSFGVAHAMTQKLEEFPKYETLILDLHSASIVGITTALVIEDIVKSEFEKGHSVYITGASDHVKETFSKLDVFNVIAQENQLKTRAEALKAATA